MDKDFDKLREALEQETWPSLYLFKFIAPSDNQKIALISEMFDGETAEVTMRDSKNGNYTSISVKEVMTSADAVIDKYKKASKIKGVIIL